jgi:hypothetical protein
MFGLKAKTQPSFPLLDGPLRPNDALEEAEAIPMSAPGDLCVAPDGALMVSSGSRVLRSTDWNADSFEQVAAFDAPVTGLACRQDGLLAVGVEGSGFRILDQDWRTQPQPFATEAAIGAATAFLFAANGDLLVADAAPAGGVYPYTRDLFATRGSGKVLRIGEDGATDVVATDLRCPHGLVEPSPGEPSTGAFVVSECWAARLKPLGPASAIGTAGFDDLPGYPARIHKRADGGYVLACLARRDPLIDFLLTEDDFVARMMAEIDQEFWVAPRLTAAPDYRYPAQSGATRLFGETKPWAPSLSYGLVVLLDDDFSPVASLHSRANGTRHGITAAIEWRGAIVAVSKGSGELLRVKQTGTPA